ncbi:c-type cytochrome [Lacibacter luteus]|uniref:C-type cytochrome n=1 Tax=Lacibacter luteus TaxID=2508719 RepID=A0A4Q1CKH0_9BACT|nr:c-type cytochrome [Lacibacter luteus]RXK60842.1 c-type cytochrome [Lacibacter luteus]
MNQPKLLLRKSFTLFLVFVCLFIANNSFAQDGKALFQTNCASCHAINKKLTGPALAGLEERGPWSDRKKLYAWIKNPSAFAKSDAYAAALMKEYGVAMTPFNLSDAEVDAIVKFVNTPVPGGDGKKTEGTGDQPAEDNSLLFGILALVLAVVALILLQINSNLKKLTDEKDGVVRGEPVAFWKNKAYIATGIILLFLTGGYLVAQSMIGLGRQTNYQPEQPIFYSHKVHAGINQVNCLYCHGSAMEGKHANIPSVNVCMNCHMAINEYKGEKLFHPDGSEVNGTAEIQKLYKYAGWDPTANKYTAEGKPIEWVKIHSLPDHVYFNHSQHTKAGGVQCQTCHGEIQKMDEVYQFSNLSMGWCINCHRETSVKFKDNGFYSMYEKFHNDIKNGKMDSVTVEKIGGTECQKCHY